MRTIHGWVLALAATGSGCHYYQEYRIKKSTADVNEQKAANLRAHRECMQRNEHRPNAADVCAVYVQQH